MQWLNKFLKRTDITFYQKIVLNKYVKLEYHIIIFVSYLIAPAVSPPENMVHFHVPPSMASVRDIVRPHESWETFALIL